MDLNADVGESFGAYTIGDDAALLAVVTSASVACGFHAGDPAVMTSTVRTALTRGVVVGAHVGYRDLQGFGRRALAIAPADLVADIVYQLGALSGVARSVGAQVRFVKPHGALYNAAAADPGVAQALVDGVVAFDAALPIVTPPNSAIVEIAASAGVPTVSECFADRAYTATGSLVSRAVPGAVVDDPDAVVARALAMAAGDPIETVDGGRLRVRAESMCVHGDTPGAAELARRIRIALEQAGVQLKSFA